MIEVLVTLVSQQVDAGELLLVSWHNGAEKPHLILDETSSAAERETTEHDDLVYNISAIFETFVDLLYFLKFIENIIAIAKLYHHATRLTIPSLEEWPENVLCLLL